MPELIDPIPFTPDNRVWRMLDRAVSRLAQRSLRLGATRVPEAPQLRTTRVRIERSACIAQGVMSFELASVGGERLPSWQPGCHIDLSLPSGRKRQYSLCGDPDATHSYRIAVRALPQGDGGSLELHGMREGDELMIGPPRNAFPFIDAPRYLFIAAGIGITAILPMVRLAHTRRAEWTFAYLGRSRASMPFLDELTELAQHAPGRMHVWADDERAGLASAAELLELAPEAAPLYACGPVPLLAALRAALPHPKVTSLHDERFSPATLENGVPFDLELARSGCVVHVGAHESALSAVRRRLPHVAYSCQQGFCGTCHVRVLAGELEPRAEPHDSMPLCVARGRGRVVIDL